MANQPRNPAVAFDPASARKIVTATRRTLGTPPPRRPRDIPYQDDGGGTSGGLKLTGVRLGAGKYTGAILIDPGSDVDPDADTVLADFGTAAAAPWDSVIAINSDEEGQTGGTHWIDPTAVGGRVYAWWLIRINDDGTPVVGFNGTQGIDQDCTGG